MVDELSADLASVHFETLCQMTERLQDDMPGEFEKRRESCKRCQRPVKVCLCEHLPDPIALKRNIKVWILMHPFEMTRVLRTTKILEACLSEKNFKILVGRRFTTERFPELEEVYNSPNSYVLFPSEAALSLEAFRDLICQSQAPKDETLSSDAPNRPDGLDSTFNIIIIDGTWAQASGIYYTNSNVNKLKQIKIDTNYKSSYVIRTQPREFYLSTLESVAIILATIEDDQKIYDDLVKPLRALCDFQLEHGAQTHHSKEYLLINGLYKKPISKQNFNQLTRDSKLRLESDRNGEA